jgi:hypothetical protein
MMRMAVQSLSKQLRKRALQILQLETVQKGDCTGREECVMWYHEVCTGAIGKKQFMYMKCM